MISTSILVEMSRFNDSVVDSQYYKSKEPAQACPIPDCTNQCKVLLTISLAHPD
jgi:hypothetical protein